MRTNNNPILYRPALLRSKAPHDYGRRFTVWYAEVGNRRTQIGGIDALMADGRDRRLDYFRGLGGDYQPHRQYRYWCG